MADPSIAMSLGDLAIRVGEYLGICAYNASTGVAELPAASTHDRDLLFRLVNDGYRRFLGANPHWHFLTPLFTITFDPTGVGAQCVNSEAYRYYMPDGFTGSFVAPLTYDDDGPMSKLDRVSEGVIRELRAAGDSTGDPTMYAIRPVPQGTVPTSTSPKWEVIFWPTPNTAYTVTGRARVFPNKLSADTDKHVAGYQHDHVILAAGMAEAERQRRGVTGQMEVQYREALSEAMRMDSESRPRKIGDYGDKTEVGGRNAGYRPYTGVDSYTSFSAGVVEF
jgi:hypothetical protein